MNYVELHARSAFSFYRGASQPEVLALEAARLGLSATALCDRDGFYGSVRHHMKSREAGGRALVGCELTMEDGSVLPVLVSSREGYRGLCSLLSTTHLRSAKGEGRTAWSELAERKEGLLALSGDEEGPVRRAWREQGEAAAVEAGDRLLHLFGKDRLYVELQRHFVEGEDEENAFLRSWSEARGLPLLATNGVLYAQERAREVLDVFTCLREHTTLDKAGRRLALNAERRLKTPAEMRALFADIPEAIENTQRLADRLEFTLKDLGYRFPDFDRVPEGENQDSWLRKETFRRGRERYGTLSEPVRRQLERELALIAKLGFSGYFLIVADLCDFAKGRGILVQGRGSAANSAVCYSLGITVVDPVGSKLLFERFLSEGRTDWPDIDLDFPSGERREEVIQEVYRRYGRRGAAMTANVITFQGRSTMREVGKVLGLPDDVLDRFSRLYHGWGEPHSLESKERLLTAGISADHPRLPVLVSTCEQLYGLPRHLGQHSGGMVISASGLDGVVPLENARMPGRSVLQWDKSDCEDMGIVKVDLLGLGMMAVLQECISLCEKRGQPVDLPHLPKDDEATYRLIQEADTIGVFQIESRAQMSTLPRMKPKDFYDLAVEVAIIRPGPIQGNAVNPYLQRRAGIEPVTYPDDRAKPALERTLGVVLFQEQILRLAMELGGFSAAEADELRRAIGFTRSTERLDKMRAKLNEALRRNGVSEEGVTYILDSLAMFALYGFPESHAISFALLAYFSAWLKVHRTAVFYTALLNNQPMGFYSPATLVQDARRRGVKTLPVCVEKSQWECVVESDESIRLGFSREQGVRETAVRKMLAERARHPFASLSDFLARTEFNPKERRVLAASGALNALAGHRRAALWRVENAPQGDELLLWAERAGEDSELTPLERMTLLERVEADYAALGLTTGRHPMALVRPYLPGIASAEELKRLPNGVRVRVAGAVTCRQRPGTGKGFCFITLEDETGHANAIVRPKLFESLREVINLETALVVDGMLQNEKGVIHVMAEKVSRLPNVEIPEQPSHNYC